MKKSFIIICVIAFALIIANGVLFVQAYRAASFLELSGDDSVMVGNSQTGVHYAAYNRASSYSALTNTSDVVTIQEKVYAGIVSHHFFVEPEITRFFLSLKEQNPKTVVIIGPNHFNAGSRQALASAYDYETPWGTLESDHAIIADLVARGSVAVEERPFEREHAISALVGFVKYVFPDAKIVPIILKRDQPFADAAALAKDLDAVLPEKSLVLGSIDFSHHLNSIAADFHDEKSIAAIQNFDFDSVPKLEVDSPQSIFALLAYLELRGAERMEYMHTNSAEFSGNMNSEDVTSYVFAHFSKGDSVSANAVSTLHFGDMMLGRNVGLFIAQDNDPFSFIRGVDGNFLRGADLIIANLEGPITLNEPCAPKDYSFRFDPETALRLRKNNISLVDVANNHSLDCYQEGLDDTRKYLDAQSVGYFGDRDAQKSYAVKKINGQSVAFVGIDTFSTSDFSPFYQIITQLKQDNNYVIVNIHWGVEYSKLPSSSQQSIGRALIDSGADMVIGHHPHVIQTMEIYKQKPIFYSLGNFIFDQDFSKETSSGFGVGAVFGENENKFYLFPYSIQNYSPKLLKYTDASAFCEKQIPDKDTSSVCRFILPAK